MKWLKWTLSAASLTAMIACMGSVLDDPDEMQVVRDYVDKTRSIALKDKDSNLRISGGVYAAHQYVRDSVAGIKATGAGSGYNLNSLNPANTNPVYPPTPTSIFPLKARLNFEFEKESIYALTALQFDNRAGLNKMQYDTASAGTMRPFYQSFYAPGSSGISLARAVIGYRLRDTDEEKLSLEFGRRKATDIYRSILQEGDAFDGALVRYKYTGTDYGTYTLDAGSFIIDNRVSHYGQMIQAGLINPDTGIFGFLSFVNRYKDGVHSDGSWGDVSKASNPATATENFQYRYRNTHAVVGIAMPEEALGKMARFSVGGAMNHKAQPIAKTGYRRDNKAYFIGMEYGSKDNFEKAGDWAIRGSLQKVGAQAIPEIDSSSAIGKPGCTTGIPFWYPQNDGTYGFGNYKGISLEVNYSIKPGVLLNVSGLYSKPNRKLGTQANGKNRMTAVQTEIAYIF